MKERRLSNHSFGRRELLSLRRIPQPAVILLMVFGVTAFLLPSCSHDCPLQAGATVTENRDLPAFNTIVLNGKINLILTQDSTQQVSVSAGKNLQPGITTLVSQQTLTIQDNNSCLLRDPSEPVNIYVSSNQLQNITYYGAGNVSSTNTLKAPQFTVDCHMGSGTIRLDLQAGLVNAWVRNENAGIVLSGTADQAAVYCAEEGSVDLSGLIASIVNIQQRSIRDVDVNVVNSLQVSIAYKGNVYYQGNPAVIDSNLTSTGQLIHQQ